MDDEIMEAIVKAPLSANMHKHKSAFRHTNSVQSASIPHPPTTSEISLSVTHSSTLWYTLLTFESNAETTDC